MADIAHRERPTHPTYLAEVLAAEVDDRTKRRRTRRIDEAKLPRLRRLADFNVDAVPTLQPATLGQLAPRHYLDAGEPPQESIAHEYVISIAVGQRLVDKDWPVPRWTRWVWIADPGPPGSPVQGHVLDRRRYSYR